MITITMETTLDVVEKQQKLVQEALGPDGAYARLKENLEMLYENADIKAQDKATAIANGLSQFMVSVTNAAMSTGLQWAEQEKTLVLQKAEMERKLALLEQQTLQAVEQTAATLADRQVKQAMLIREYGVASKDSNGNVTALDNSGKEYYNILNIQADTSNKSKQAEVLDSTKQQNWAQTHRIVADTYVNHGVFTWTGLTNTGLTGVSKANTGFTTLSDMQKVVSGEQAKGYSYNAWSNAASAGASMLGTLAGAEIQSIDATSWAEMINLWKTPTQHLGAVTTPAV